jgi:DNA-binding MarR family transcriptional regulator
MSTLAVAGDADTLSPTATARARRIARQAPSVGARLRQAGQFYTEAFTKALPLPDGVTESQYEVLSAVATYAPCSQTDLVAATGIDRSTLADVVRRLVRRGLLKRHRTKRDRRAYAVDLTADGRKACAKAGAVVEKLDAGIGAEVLKSLPRR